MSITTAAELQTALTNWSNRTDLAGRYGEFISLVEARFNRKLRVRTMEASLASTALVDGALTLPTGFLAFKELRYDAADSYALEPRPIQWLRSVADQSTAPLYFAVSGTQLVCWPQVGNVKGTYYTSIPSLNDNSSNWLLTASPDLYLFACLAEIGNYIRDDKLIAMAGARAEALLDELNGSDLANAMNGGPLQVRPRVAVR